MSPSFQTLVPELQLYEKRVIDFDLNLLEMLEQWASHGPAVLFESGGMIHEASEWSILAGYPSQELLDSDEGVGEKSINGALRDFPELWDTLDGSDFSFKDQQPFPYCLAKAWFGILSYEFGKAITLSRGKVKSSFKKIVPHYYFFKPSRVVAFNRANKEYLLFGEGPISIPKEPRPRKDPFRVAPIHPQLTSNRYRELIEKVKIYIDQGDIYQANLAQAFQSEWQGTPGDLYAKLRELNPAPFMGIFQGKDFTVLSSSPERLVTGKGNYLETKPIAGTRPRSLDPLRDDQLKMELRTNPKELAEHLMLVDLARNDIGRVAHFGSVEVKKFAQVESFSKVHHLVSTVQAQRRPAAKFSQIIKSFFPGGTITGCPKVRCMEIIDELENRARGFYTGSMGYIAPGHSFDFNILIRSFTLWPGGTLEFFAGAGIVADSDPQKEYLETLYKVEALACALGASLVKNP